MPAPSTFFMPNSPATAMDLYSLAFQIFAADWKTFIGLGLLLNVAMIGVMIVYLILAFVALATQLETLLPCFRGVDALTGSNNNGGRFLADHYLVGDGGVSRRLMGRMLDDYYEVSNSMAENCDLDNISTGTVAAVFVVVVLLVVLVGLASSTFVGAFIHAASESIVADNAASLSVRRSMSWGWKSKFAVFCYQMLFALAVVVAPLAVIALVIFLGKSLSLGILALVAWLVFAVVASTANVGAIPSIVVEKVGVLKAFPRSWGLTKSSFCLVFCTVLGFQVAAFVVALLFNFLISRSPQALAVLLTIVRFVFSISVGVIGAILSTVIYTSLRIRKESTSPEELSQNLDLAYAEATVVEMVDGEGSYKDSIGKNLV